MVKWRNSRIIDALFIVNLLFDGLAYNTSGHFAHCSYYYVRNSASTPQLTKYPHVLYAKPSNKVYLFSTSVCGSVWLLSVQKLSKIKPCKLAELQIKEGDILRVFDTSRKDVFLVGKVRMSTASCLELLLE